MTENSGRTLLVFETYGVKSWLFTSPILRETRGASILLDILNRKQVREALCNTIADTEIVYLGGGSGKLIFTTEEQARQGQEIIEGLYQEKAPGAKISIHFVPIQEDFSHVLNKALKGCRQKKQAGGINHHSQIAGRWLRPCSSCGTGPAAGQEEELGTRHFLCISCLAKREQVMQLYQDTKSGMDRPLRSAEDLGDNYMQDFLFTTLAKHFQAKYQNQSLYLPQSTNDIGQASQPENYLGFIYADGDRMGQIVQEIGRNIDEERQKKAYKEFSDITDRATREAAVEAVLGQLLPLPQHADGLLVPAEFLMAGGDDLMLLVPAHAALDIALSFMELFQQKSKELLQKSSIAALAPDGLTCSAGIVLAHAHYPVSELMDFAADLMKNAKKKSLHCSQTGKVTGSLDFMVLAESSSKSLAERRTQEYEQKTAQQESIRLTERPYTVGEAQDLLQWIRESKAQEIPRNKLIALYEALFKNPYSAQFEALNIRQRLLDTGDLKEEEDNPLYTLFWQTLNRFPYRQQDTASKEWTSFLSEFVELYDFIHNRGMHDENMDLQNGV